MVNNDSVYGSIMCVSSLCTVWNVAKLEDVTPDSLALLDVVRPSPGLNYYCYSPVLDLSSLRMVLCEIRTALTCYVPSCMSVLAPGMAPLVA